MGLSLFSPPRFCSPQGGCVKVLALVDTGSNDCDLKGSLIDSWRKMLPPPLRHHGHLASSLCRVFFPLLKKVFLVKNKGMSYYRHVPVILFMQSRAIVLCKPLTSKNFHCIVFPD